MNDLTNDIQDAIDDLDAESKVKLNVTENQPDDEKLDTLETDALQLETENNTGHDIFDTGFNHIAASNNANSTNHPDIRDRVENIGLKITNIILEKYGL